MATIIQETLGSGWGDLLLADVVLAIAVCTLTVHAAAVRLVFAMARDNGLPGSSSLARMPGSTRTPTLPAILLGLGAAGDPGGQRQPPADRRGDGLGGNRLGESRLPLRDRAATGPEAAQPGPGTRSAEDATRRNLSQGTMARAGRIRPSAVPGGEIPGMRSRANRTDRLFSLGRWGLLVNVLAVAWGVLIVVNVGWPRIEVYGEPWYRRFAAPLATAAMLGAGWAGRGRVGRREAEVLEDHRAPAMEVASVSGSGSGITGESIE